MSPDQERQILKRAKTNIQAFGELYDYYLPLIYRFVFSRLGNKEAAEDVSSQTFLAATENFANFAHQENAKFSSWLYRIASNKVVDYYRSKHSQTAQLPSYETADTSGESESNADAEYNALIVQQILGKMPEDKQLLISLRFFAELSNSEIADELDLEVNNVAVKLHRALQDFKLEMQKIYKNFEIF